MQIWLYEEELKCLNEMIAYPVEAQTEYLLRQKIEKVLNNLFTFECKKT